MRALLYRNVLEPIDAWRNRSQHLRYLDLLEKSQFDDPEVIQTRQWLAVQKLLFHAWHTVPFYRSAWETIDFHPSDCRNWHDFSQLPVLTKNDLRNSQESLHSSAYAVKDLTRKSTSGSTGVPVHISLDKRSLEWKRACTIRSDQWSGWQRGCRVAKVWGNPEYHKHGLKGKLRNLLMDRAIYLDTLQMDSESIKNFIRELQKYPPYLIFGHAHSLYLLANAVKKEAPDSIIPKGIISTAMVLNDWQRKTIEAVFHCPVTNRYGCEEVSLIACECEKHSGLHLNADSIVAEVQKGIHLRDGNSGDLLLTDLTNYAMPLIRYRVGDVVSPSQEVCSCGRGLPTLERIEGREADYVVTPSGKLISGISLTENFAMLIPGVAQIQMVQDSLTRLLLRIVPDEKFQNESYQAIANLVETTFGLQMRYEVEIVDQIAQEPSGKYRFCISSVASEYLRAAA